MDGIGALLAFAGVIGYIRRWRTEKIRLRCLELARGERLAFDTIGDTVTRADIFERYVRKGKPKEPEIVGPPPPPPPYQKSNL